jgi:hypothetical protein
MGTLRSLVHWWRVRRCANVLPLGLYLPFWLFDGAVEVCWALGDGVAAERVAHDRPFRDLLVSGVDLLPASLLQRLYPFDLQHWTEFEPGSLANSQVIIGNVEPEAAADRVRDLVLRLVKLRTREDGRGRPHTRPAAGRRSPAFLMGDTTYRLVLVPLWVARVDDGNGRVLILVNGQTGRVAVGAIDVPTDSTEPVPEGSLAW